ncbi:MAG TPA: beta-propeller fold lactonase family protein [Jatrophihabitantaceae bacterium]
MTNSIRIAVASRVEQNSMLVVLDADTGQRVGELDGWPGALAMVLHPDGHALYVADGIGELLSISLSGDGEPALLGRRPSGGQLPCALAIDPSGRFVVTAHYATAELTVHPIGADLALEPLAWTRPHRRLNGSGPVAGRQDSAHLHHVDFDPGRGTAVITDLGADRLYEYAFGPDGQPDLVDEVVAPSGSGPRHSVFHPDGSLLVSDELSSTLSRYRRHPDTGRLECTDTVDTRDGADGPDNYPSELVLGPNAEFVYVANRGRDTIAVIELTRPRPTLVQEQPCGGAFPQHLAVVGEQLLCANLESDTIAALPIDAGRLGEARPVASVPGPVWISVLHRS